MLNTSCAKSNTPSAAIERVDTVRYEALLNSTNGYWCIESFIPKSLFPGSSSNDTSYTAGECGQTQNQEFEFTVNKYKNKTITLWTKGNDQFDGSLPGVYYDSIVTLNIYVNNALVATQSSRVKDSIQYVIH